LPNSIDSNPDRLNSERAILSKLRAHFLPRRARSALAGVLLARL
jgi:hypothetical protein